MRTTTRVLALGLTGLLLAACGHKRAKDVPLAYVPVDTPYVLANLELLDDATRQALLAQADAQLPAQLQQLRAAADELAARDPEGARLLRALAGELDGKSIAQFAHDVGLDIKGYSAVYGLGLAPVARFQLADPAAFDAFVGRLEAAYGKALEQVAVDGQRYRRYVLPASGTQFVLAQVGRQAVAALLPAEAPRAMLRQTFGLDRPEHNLEEDDRLRDLAKAKGYQPWLVGQLDLTRALPMLASGKDPLFAALRKAHAETESARTGEPVANQLQSDPSCAADAARIAARVPAVSLGYTRLEAHLQEVRFDVALAGDITQAFMQAIALPGLGGGHVAPFDFSLALPVMQMRSFWTAQADAVTAKPFTCPALVDLNETFAKLGLAMQKAAMPPFGDLLGVRLALDRLDLDEADAKSGRTTPTIKGSLLVASRNPAGLLATGQMMNPALAELKIHPDGKPVALPAALSAAFGQPGWLAMTPQVLALAIGQDADTSLARDLADPPGAAGQLLRAHVDGAMYLTWVKLLQDKADTLADIGGPATGQAGDVDAEKAAARERLRRQFAAMRTQAERIKSLRLEAHLENAGLVLTSTTEFK
ncbi:hypothetical protein [Aerosticca soli]|uniref:Uncharacterized protein n=1 Tax=Aerosticca soli TaxID=2010829 RepID=A0A2Z6E4U0_9GAMM|nr:hypothetical protein [Aerosticca soli]BBD80110.1 hypothetical protein ALSL_1453 [Aerosticca soli]